VVQDTHREEDRDRESGHHSAVPYFVVWALLAFFTLLTYWTGRMHLGTWALPLALGIAITKSSLVVLFFMHLYEQRGANRLVILTSFVFVALIITLTVADVATRFNLATPAGAPFGTDVPAQLEEGEAPEHVPSQGPVGQPPGPEPH
jgi:cytochrome c oxidase subunit IV